MLAVVAVPKVVTSTPVPATTTRELKSFDSKRICDQEVWTGVGGVDRSRRCVAQKVMSIGKERHGAL